MTIIGGVRVGSPAAHPQLWMHLGEYDQRWQLAGAGEGMAGGM